MVQKMHGCLTGSDCARETTILPVNVRVIIANIFPDNFCPFKSVPWLVKTYTDEKSAYVKDTSHARKAEKTAYLPGAQFPGNSSARELCPLAIRNVYDSKIKFYGRPVFFRSQSKFVRIIKNN